MVVVVCVCDDESEAPRNSAAPADDRDDEIEEIVLLTGPDEDGAATACPDLSGESDMTATLSTPREPARAADVEATAHTNAHGTGQPT